ncbi:MAG: hypothetical protein ACR9NN_10020 [Nostochopsis sp.]
MLLVAAICHKSWDWGLGMGKSSLSQLPITHYPLPITHYPLPITHYPLPITHYPLPKTVCS